MLPTGNRKFDRTLFGLSIVSAWTLPCIFVWAFLQPNDLPRSMNYAALACAVSIFCFAYVITFTLGGLRYVMTGSEFKD